MNKAVIVILSVGLLVSLTGCMDKDKGKDQKEVRSIQWFMDHDPERKSQLEMCMANADKVAMPMNCTNAKQAEMSLTEEGSDNSMMGTPTQMDKSEKGKEK